MKSYLMADNVPEEEAKYGKRYAERAPARRQG